jgi:HAD superfamily hydrolase (TIGR01549 family)
MKIDAILWDFDGTLADSAAKNIAISKQILTRVAPRLTGDKLPACLQSVAAYHIANHSADHWRELYRDFFGMNPGEIETAGPLWETYQLLDETEVMLFDGVSDAVTRLANYPQGICSANSTRFITKVLDQYGLTSCFEPIIGYEELPAHEQKPAPEGGLRALENIFGQTHGKTIIYIGDHIADVLFARALGKRLGPSNTVFSAVVTYSGARPERWREQPDEIFDNLPSLLSWVG